MKSLTRGENIRAVRRYEAVTLLGGVALGMTLVVVSIKATTVRGYGVTPIGFVELRVA